MDGDRSIGVATSQDMQKYFDRLHQELSVCYDIASAARKKGFDPSFDVEIPRALDLAARVEQLVGPKGIAPQIRKTTKKIGNRELVSLEIAKEIAKGTKYKFDKIEDALDQSIRTGLAILTEGVLVAPLEGIAEVKLGSNKDGTNYVDLFFSGPIRSAGGTGQAMSVLIADVVRRQLNIAEYKPTDGEIERYKEEIPLYKRVQHLQYLPTVDEIDQVVRSCPICINGEGTEDEEVTGYRDLPRIETNRLRGGACLVIAEGLCLKAPKIQKHVKKLKLKGWEFLEQFINKTGNNAQESTQIPEILPSTKYIGDVIAGRPVLSHPSRKGGFRLRYGRARTAGLASTAINPASMYLLNGFITVGTQMKTERPGKGTIGTPCDQIEGPIVQLFNGDLVQINNTNNLRHDIKQIIDLGEILIPYGEFIENNALLPDASYTYEWWIQELQKALNILPKTQTTLDIIKADKQTKDLLETEFTHPINLYQPTVQEAITLSEKYNIPLHPYYNLFWHDITIPQLHQLQQAILEDGKIDPDNPTVLQLPYTEHTKSILVELGALHQQREGSLLLQRYGPILIRCCGLTTNNHQIIKTNRYTTTYDDSTPLLKHLSQLSGIPIRARSPIRIGTRMGRPEKASPRKMKPPPHVLFPLGNYGGNQRLMRTASEQKNIEIEAGKRICPSCKKTTFLISCSCGKHTQPLENRIETFTVNLSQELQHASQRIKERKLPDTIKGVMGTISKHKTPEPLEKGILRAKHNIHVFKDGTIRFDMTDAPLTHFRPKEIGVSVKKLKLLGYNKDYLGNPLTSDSQLCELKAQDIIVSTSCAEFFMQVAKFVDDLLSKLYQQEKFYKLRRMQDLTGHLVIGLAPHTSAGALARIIGFTSAQVCYGHPYFHATKRRNADGDEDGLILVMDALLNFSHSYIPDKRGGRMDLPLIITTRIDPAEVDKEAHNLDTHARYPLAFYEETLQHAHSKKLESMMGLVSERIGTELQYERIGFTHDTTDISTGPKESTYKALKNMPDKMKVQLELAGKIRAVDEIDVANKVIERHFLPDILGNLRAFSKQSVRCPQCNTTFRRIPLKGVCNKCNGKLTLTVHKMSVKKYLEITQKIALKYNLPIYAQQRITLVEKSINSLFQSDRIRFPTIEEFIKDKQK